MCPHNLDLEANKCSIFVASALYNYFIFARGMKAFLNIILAVYTRKVSLSRDALVILPTDLYARMFLPP